MAIFLLQELLMIHPLMALEKMLFKTANKDASKAT
jgi:hypothetical protein